MDALLIGRSREQVDDSTALAEQDLHISPDLLMLNGFPETSTAPPSTFPVVGADIFSPSDALSHMAGTWRSPSSPGDAAAEPSMLADGWGDWEDWTAYDWGDVPGTQATGLSRNEDSSIHEAFSTTGSVPLDGVPLSSSTFDFSLPPSATASVLADSIEASSSYSTPQSLDSMFGLGSGSVEISSLGSSPLANIEEEPTNGLHQEFGGYSSPRNAPKASSTEASSQRPTLSKKRKATSTRPDVNSEEAKPKRVQNQDRHLHSKVEKRYRMRLNDKIAALRDCIPDLRSQSAGQSPDSDDDDRDDLALKVNKSTVMDKAKEYILRLEAENKQLREEKKTALEKLDLIGHAARVAARQPGEAGQSGRSLSRVVIAVLAGVMTTESFHTSQQSNGTPGGRGLFAVPTWLLGPLTRPLHHLSFVHGSAAGDAPLLLAKFLLLFSAIAYLIWPFIFRTEPKKQTKPAPGAVVGGSSASPAPIALRRNAFLTAKQTVWIPEGWWPETLALVLKLLKLGLQHIHVNWLVYNRSANTPQEAESARVKAWDVAIDAQLLGGDPHVDTRRLLLTYLAGASLPESPYRRMLMALHIRVLACRFNERGKQFAEGPLMKISGAHWKRARLLRSQPGQEALPSHLQHLLGLEVDDALRDEVLQRACGLIWRAAHASPYSTLADSVGNDPSVSTPLDAVAAWWAAGAMQESLLCSVEPEDGGNEAQQSREDARRALDLALRIAPMGSAVFMYGLAARAVLADRDKSQYCTTALRTAGTTPASWLAARRLDGSGFRGELTLALKGSIATALLGEPSSGKALLALGKHMEQLTADFGVLGFATLYRVTEGVFRDKEVASGNRELLERAATLLRMWTGQDRADAEELAPEAQRRVVHLCMQVFEWLVGKEASDDEGYCTTT